MASKAARSASGSRAKCTGQRWTNVPRRWWCKPTIDEWHSSQRVSSNTAAGAGISFILRGAACDQAHDDAGQSDCGAYRWVAAWCSLAKPRSLHCRPRAAHFVRGTVPIDGTQIGRSGESVFGPQTRVWRALAEIEVVAFETFEPRAPEIVFCTSIGLAKVETHRKLSQLSAIR
jgi:hypothetical protein